jgi:CRP/FNR family transcriptional regulator, nitrogen fixation regulation protein
MWKEARLTQSDRHGGQDDNTSYQRPPAIGLDSIAVIARRNRGEEIHDSEGSEQYWYRVISGAAKCFVVLPGGRRQILDLLVPNDCFCFSPPAGHYGAVEAVANGTVVACYARRRAEALAETDPKVAREIHDMALDAVSRMQEQILILGRVTAREKVGSFLINMMERSSKQPNDRLLLFTSRYDIADYLALSVETVSRSLTDLRHRGFIALAGPRSVKIVDRSGLEEGDSSM